MNKQHLIELKQKQSTLEFEEKNLTQLVESKKRNVTTGMVLSIGSLVLALLVSQFTSSESWPEIFISIGGGVYWYSSRKSFAEKKKELDSLVSQIEENKQEIIREENT